MKNYNRYIGWVIIISFLFGPLANNVYAQSNENQMKTTYEQDETLIRTYVESVNDEAWINIPGLFESEQEAILLNVLSDENSKLENVGIYNVTYIHDYEMHEIENYNGDEYSNYCDIEEYLLYLNCSVIESNMFFKDGNNYYRLVTGMEGNSRKILELSVASEVLLENIVDFSSEIISVGDFNEYIDSRNEVINSIDDFELKVVEQISDNISRAAEYGPKVLSSYSFPSTIRIYNTTDKKIYSRNFKNYCYVVCSSEFSCGTDGPTAVNIEALKALGVCIRNVGWYRCLYPLNATAGYNVTDSENDSQKYLWSNESTVTTSYPNQVSAINDIWNVMMFDGAKKLFYPSYRSGSYNGNRDTSHSKLYQNGANFLATVLGYKYDAILHYYYDSAAGDEITLGPIIVCKSHNRALIYTKNLNGHGKACLTCGHITLTAHTWVNHNNQYYKCSVCGYESQVIVADIE